MQQTCWQIPSGVTLLFREWDQQVVVFHKGSGDTHLISAAAAQLLQLLQDSSPLSTDQISAQYPTTNEQEYVEQCQGIEAALQQLASLGLVSAVA